MLISTMGHSRNALILPLRRERLQTLVETSDTWATYTRLASRPCPPAPQDTVSIHHEPIQHQIFSLNGQSPKWPSTNQQAK